MKSKEIEYTGALIFISGLGIIVYSNTFFCSFHFDDIYTIVDNFFIKNISNLQNIWNFLPRRFFLYLSIALNYHFNRLDVFGYHLFNLGVHLITAILVWWFTLLTLSTPAMKDRAGFDSDASFVIALLTGLVFVSHPVQTEAVTYIVQRTASMATMFYVASLCFYVKSRLLQENKSNSGLWKFYYVGSLLMTIVAMFTKETAITLPLAILLYEFSFLRNKKSFNWGYLIPFLLAISIIPLTMMFTESPEAQKIRGIIPEGPSGITSMHYLLTQFRVMVTYIRLVFVPLNQNLDYDYPISTSIFELPTLFSFLFLITILFSAIRLFSRYRLISFSIFWFFLTLLPESSFLPIKDVIYEHRLYLPLVGYSMFLVSGVFYLWGKNNIKIMITVLTMIIGCNSVLTYQRNKIWKDDFTLWNDAIQKSPHKARPYNNRGLNYAKQDKFTQAISDFNKAITLNPVYADPYYNRGVIYYNQGINTQAMSDYSKAIEINPYYYNAYNNRGVIYYKQGNITQAISDYNNAIEINPNGAEAYKNRGNAYDKQGNFTQAIADYTKAIELNPQDSEAYKNLGSTYDKQGDMTQAMSNYDQAITLNPNYCDAYYNRGIIYAKQGSLIQAMADFTKAIEINPKYAEAYNNRGSVNFEQGNFTQAIVDYTKAITLNPQEGSYSNRAATYYKLKKYDDAWADVHQAEALGLTVNPNFINELSQATGQK